MSYPQVWKSSISIVLWQVHCHIYCVVPPWLCPSPQFTIRFCSSFYCKFSRSSLSLACKIVFVLKPGHHFFGSIFFWQKLITCGHVLQHMDSLQGPNVFASLANWFSKFNGLQCNYALNEWKIPWGNQRRDLRAVATINYQYNEPEDLATGRFEQTRGKTWHLRAGRSVDFVSYPLVFLRNI